MTNTTFTQLLSGRLTAGQRKLKSILGETPAALDAFSFEVFGRMASKFQEQTNHVTPSQLFRACAEVIEQTVSTYVDVDTTAQDSFMPYLRFVKLLVQGWVQDGMMTYTASKGNKESGAYSLNADRVVTSITALLREAGKGQAVGFRKNKGTRHEQGARAMAKRVFMVNIERAKECREHLNAGEFLNRDEQWTTATTDKELRKLEQQNNQFRALVAAYRHTQGAGFSFDVMPDFRGRLYYVAGNLNPQAGGVAFYCLHNANQITLDSTASFAQFMAMVTGSQSLGAACGLTNYTTTPCDFYALTYAAATGEDAPEKKTITRLLSKIYLMPKAYGCSDATSIKRAKEEAKERGVSEDIAEHVVNALSSFEELNVIKNAAGRVAVEAAINEKQMSWRTPFGFNVVQDYWITESRPWSVEGNAEYMPSTIHFAFKSNKVAISDAVQHGDNARTADIAAAANLIQSLDAAFIAEVAVRYYEQTGETFTAIHDSATLDNPDHEELYMTIAWTVFIDMMHSNAIANIRAMLGLVNPDMSWINESKTPLFICRE